MIQNRLLSHALSAFCSNAKTQSQAHIKPMHQYGALRLVLEGGFVPESVLPRPPFDTKSVSSRNAPSTYSLNYDATMGNPAEANVLGLVRAKQMDVAVRNVEAGPTLGISFRGTTEAFRNIPNRMEEIIGDVTNVHLRYPAFTYGYCHLIKFARIQDVSDRGDASFSNNGQPLPYIEQLHALLSELVGRRRTTDRVELWESTALLVVECSLDGAVVHSGYPPASSPVYFGQFFERLYRIYDERYAYVAGDRNQPYSRKYWRLSTNAATSALGLGPIVDGNGPFPYTLR